MYISLSCLIMPVYQRNLHKKSFGYLLTIIGKYQKIAKNQSSSSLTTTVIECSAILLHKVVFCLMLQISITIELTGFCFLGKLHIGVMVLGFLIFRFSFWVVLRYFSWSSFLFLEYKTPRC